MPKGTSRNVKPNEEGIYIEFKPVAHEGIEISDYLHSYLVYEDGQGNAEVIRGGFPGPEAIVGGDITVQSGVPLQQSKDAYKPGETPESRIRTKVDLNGRDPKVMRDKFNKTAQEIGRAKIDYDGFPDQNSNSLVRAVLEKNGVDPQKVIPANISMDRLPGYENNLSDPYDGIDKLLGNDTGEKTSGTQDGDKAEQPPQPGPGNTDLKGSSGKDDLSDRESAQPAYAPEIQNFLEDLKKSDDPVSEILLKDSSDWTQQEVNQVHASDAYQIASNPKRAEATGKVKAWYDQHYTKNPVQKDETGKTVDPVFTTVPRKEPVAAKGKDGQPVFDGVLGAGAKIADMAGKNCLSTAIRGAQVGFNLLRKLQSGSENARRPGLLKTDGLFGPRTKQALRGSVAELGRPKVENAVALGSFQNLLEKKRGDLAQTAHDSFSGLFQKPAPFRPDDKSPTPWGLVVQDTINDFGGDAFKSLKSDGWIGPKTADAFRRTVKPSGMGGFLEKLGSNFGFF